MQGFEASCLLNERLPDLGLVEVRAVPQVVVDLLLDVARVGQLHHDAEGLRAVVEEGFPVVDDVGVGDGGQDAHLVQRVLAFLLAHVQHFHLLQRVDVVVLVPPHLVDAAVSPITYRLKINARS